MATLAVVGQVWGASFDVWTGPYEYFGEKKVALYNQDIKTVSIHPMIWLNSPHFWGVNQC